MVDNMTKIAALKTIIEEVKALNAAWDLALDKVEKSSQKVVQKTA